MALYFYRNLLTNALVYSDQPSAPSGNRNMELIGEQTNMNPSNASAWVFDDMRSMFTSVEKDDRVSGKIPGLTSMYSMFINCSSLTSLDLSGFDISKVTNMGSVFQNCSGLTSLDLLGFDTSQVTNMTSMFNGCSGFTFLDLSGFDTSKVTLMSSMFQNCSSLTSIDLSGFDTSKVMGMPSMFYGCSGLTSLDLSGFDTSKVTGMFNMFQNCSSLVSLDLSGFDTSKIMIMDNMFAGCVSLRILAISGSMSNVLPGLPKYQYYPAAGGAAVAKADLTAGTWIRDLGDRDLLTSLAQQSSAFKALSDRLGRLEEKVLGSSQAPSYGTSAPDDKLTSIVAQAQAVMSIRRRITALAKQAAKAQ